MSLNENDLLKIKKATSGWFKKSARSSISQALLAMEPRIISAKDLDDLERVKALKVLMNEATSARQRAMQSGANSFGHPEWAAAAACESWIHELLGGSSESISRVEQLISELSNR